MFKLTFSLFISSLADSYRVCASTITDYCIMRFGQHKYKYLFKLDQILNQWFSLSYDSFKAFTTKQSLYIAMFRVHRNGQCYI